MYKNLFYSVITLFTGVSILMGSENNHPYGWLILSISFGYFVTFFLHKRSVIKSSKKYYSYCLMQFLLVY